MDGVAGVKRQMRLKFENIPIPEAHVIGIILSVLVRLFLPARIFRINWVGHALGWPLVVTGLLLSLWAATEARDMLMVSPDRLITSGPYAFSRNPMYVGWTLIFLGLIFILNTLWSFGLLIVVLIFTHLFVIQREEANLQKSFGAEYERYRERVRRYI